MSNDPLVNNLAELERILKNINWDFYPRPLSSKKNPKIFNCRKYHWYPATFIPEIPYTLIELLTKPHAKIFDPFAGIGTTYFQALLLNRLPICADICSFSTEFINLLFTLFNPVLDLITISQEIRSELNLYSVDVDYSRKLDRENRFKFLKELEKWYTRKNFHALCFLFYLESKTKNNTIKSAFKISISSILSTISNQDRGWGCIADNVLPKNYQVRQVDVLNSFLSALNKLITDIERFKEKLDYEDSYRKTANQKSIFHSNILNLNEISDDSIDFVLTSPPYPNMVDYVTSQRLSYYYFGIDLLTDKNSEIGARSKRKRLSSLDDYMFQMNSANKKISKTIKKGGYLCYIMPSFNTKNNNNIKRKTIVRNVISNLEELDLRNVNAKLTPSDNRILTPSFFE